MWEYRATVLRVVDGDTIDCSVDLGFCTYQHVRFRLARIDAPEPRGATRDEGKAARLYLSALILGQSVTISSEKTGSWGRWIAEVIGPDRLNVSDSLVLAGHAVYREY